jgi:hypothetical protein
MAATYKTDVFIEQMTALLEVFKRRNRRQESNAQNNAVRSKAHALD